jgi:hypothetical protein
MVSFDLYIRNNNFLPSLFTGSSKKDLTGLMTNGYGKISYILKLKFYSIVVQIFIFITNNMSEKLVWFSHVLLL